MFGAHTSKHSRRNYQDSMKDNPNSGVQRKTQKTVRFQIEEDKVIEAHVTHWQELAQQASVPEVQRPLAFRRQRISFDSETRSRAAFREMDWYYHILDQYLEAGYSNAVLVSVFPKQDACLY